MHFTKCMESSVEDRSSKGAISASERLQADLRCVWVKQSTNLPLILQFS